MSKLMRRRSPALKSGTSTWEQNYGDIKDKLHNGPVIHYKLINDVKTRLP